MHSFKAIKRFLSQHSLEPHILRAIFSGTLLSNTNQIKVKLKRQFFNYSAGSFKQV